MASTFQSCNGSPLGYYIESPLHYRDAGSSGVDLSGIILGVGTLTGKLALHFLTVTGQKVETLWVSSGGAFSMTSTRVGPDNNIAGAVTTTSDASHAQVNRCLQSYTVLSTDAAFVGQELYLTCKPFSSAGSVNLDMYVSSPAVGSATFANCISGTVNPSGPIVGGGSGTVATTFDLGITLPAVGSSFSVGYAIHNDTSLLVFTGSAFSYLTSGPNGRYYTVS